MIENLKKKNLIKFSSDFIIDIPGKQTKISKNSMLMLKKMNL